MATCGAVNRRSRTEIPISVIPKSGHLPGKRGCREPQIAIQAGQADLRCRRSQNPRGKAVFGAAANPNPARNWRLTLPQVASPERPAALTAPKKRILRKKRCTQRFLSPFRDPFSSSRHFPAKESSRKANLRKYGPLKREVGFVYGASGGACSGRNTWLIGALWKSWT